MRPKDLKATYTWETREPQLRDQLLSIPGFYDQHEAFSMPLLPEYFGNDNPVHLEICSGNGEWIIERAKSHPEYNWIAVEKQFKRVRKIWSKMKNTQVKNLLIVSGMGEDLLTHYLQPESIDALYINFPDPWPKKRHAKHRIIKHSFLTLIARVLKKGAPIHIVSDDPPFRDQTKEIFAESKQFTPIQEIDLSSDYGSSYFNRLWDNLGRRSKRITCNRS